jgi:hypothetical protein
VKDAFDAMLREFCGTGPVEEVPFGAVVGTTGMTSGALDRHSMQQYARIEGMRKAINSFPGRWVAIRFSA